MAEGPRPLEARDIQVGELRTFVAVGPLDNDATLVSVRGRKGRTEEGS